MAYFTVIIGHSTNRSLTFGPFLDYDQGEFGGDPMDAKKTGALIAKLRTEMKMTQTDLAERLGVTNKAVSRWETGRGYPDIEILPELAKVLGISVQELLDGEVRQTEQEDCSLQILCTYAGQQRRRKNKWIIAFGTVIAILFILWLIPAAMEFYDSIIGSERCVIARDYSSMIFYGEEYVPLPLNGYECVPGEKIVGEAQVEGTGFLGKLFFGERVYEVKNAPDNELIYLQTDQDVLVSDVYVLKSEFEKYEQILEISTFDCYYFSCWSNEEYTKEFPMDSETYEGITVVDAGTARSEATDGRMVGRVYVYEEKHIFRRLAGEVERAGDTYYWSPSEYREDWGKLPGYYMIYRDQKFYPIAAEFTGELARYVEYIGK